MKKAFRFDRGQLLPAQEKGDKLYLDGYITRCGVFPYRTDEGVRRELRPPEEVLKTDSAASFANCPTTDGHPPEFVNDENFQDYAVGMTGPDVEILDGGFVRVKQTVFEKEAKDKAKNGQKRENSCGYGIDIEHTDGVWTNPWTGEKERFDAIQRNIEGNHVALVEKGRAGSDCANRLDSSTGIIRPFSRGDSEHGIVNEVPTDLPFAPASAEWDGDQARQDIRQFAGAEESEAGEGFYQFFLWVDESEYGNLTAAKFPVAAEHEGTLKVYPRALETVSNVLQGGMGGTDIPEDDQKEMWGELKKGYSAARKKVENFDRELTGSLSGARQDNWIKKYVEGTGPVEHFHFDRAASDRSRKNDGSTLSTVLNVALERERDLGKTAKELKRDIVRASDLTMSGINSILNNKSQCPRLDNLQAAGRILNVDMDTLVAAAKMDGCRYDNFQGTNQNTDNHSKGDQEMGDETDAGIKESREGDKVSYTIRLDNKEINNVEKPVADAFGRIKEERDDAVSRLEEKEAKLDELQSQVEEKEAKLDELEQKLEENEGLSEDIVDRRAKERLDIMAAAAHFDIELETGGKRRDDEIASNAELKKQLVESRRGKKLDDKSEAYFDSAFDIMFEDVSESSRKRDAAMESLSREDGTPESNQRPKSNYESAWDKFNRGDSGADGGSQPRNAHEGSSRRDESSQRVDGARKQYERDMRNNAGTPIEQ